MVEWLPEFAAQVITIYNGIDLEEYRVTERDCTERDTRIIISAGRLTEQKNYETAIDAIGRIGGRALEAIAQPWTAPRICRQRSSTRGCAMAS